MKYARFTHPLSIAFEERIYNQIKAIAEQRRISMADLVREMAEKTFATGQVNDSDDSLKI